MIRRKKSTEQAMDTSV